MMASSEFVSLLYTSPPSTKSYAARVVHRVVTVRLHQPPELLEYPWIDRSMGGVTVPPTSDYCRDFNSVLRIPTADDLQDAAPITDYKPVSPDPLL